MTNPDNFVEHRKALMKLSVQIPALAAAWRLTRERRYADYAARHVRAWFVDEATRMNPNLQYARTKPGCRRFGPIRRGPPGACLLKSSIKFERTAKKQANWLVPHVVRAWRLRLR